MSRSGKETTEEQLLILAVVWDTESQLGQDSVALPNL